jgi:hypothetical protein
MRSSLREIVPAAVIEIYARESGKLSLDSNVHSGGTAAAGDVDESTGAGETPWSVLVYCRGGPDVDTQSWCVPMDTSDERVVVSHGFLLW